MPEVPYYERVIHRVIYRVGQGNVQTRLSQAWTSGGAKGDVYARYPNGGRDVEVIGVQRVDILNGLTQRERNQMFEFAREGRMGDVKTAGEAAARTKAARS